jgi:MinD-like ATPase involved in chromosome partitioning or flagellar assembly
MAQIISIHSFRGGTGKSNLTANIAVAVAKHGKRVAIVDTDIQSPGIHVLFNIDEEKFTYALNDYLWGKCSLKDTAYDVTSQITNADGTPVNLSGVVYLVPSSLKAGEIAKVLRESYNVGLLNEGFHDLLEQLQLDYLFIDTHPGLNEETLLSVAISDRMVIILRPDRQDYLGTAVTLDVAQKLDVPEITLLINKAPSAYPREILTDKVEAQYGVPVGGLFYENDEMLRLASGGIFWVHFPDHAFSSEVHAVAHHLIAAE